VSFFPFLWNWLLSRFYCDYRE